MAIKKGLGRGLDALIADPETDPDRSGAPLEVPVESIAINPLQPRTHIGSNKIRSLADSIRDKGLLEPLLVRRIGPDQYELIAGERRLRACKQAGLKRVPVNIRAATRVELLELALIENLHREDLNPMEEAEAYQRLAEEFSRTQEEIARLVGRDRSTVANLMRLLGLPPAIQEDVRQGRLTVGHARALLALPHPDQMLLVREQVLGRQLSVRETERLVKKLTRPAARPRASTNDQAYYQALSDSLTRAMGMKVRLIPRGKRGRIEITYSSLEELERLMTLVGVDPV